VDDLSEDRVPSVADYATTMYTPVAHPSRFVDSSMGEVSYTSKRVLIDLARLSEKQRNVVILRQQGHSDDDIARRLGEDLTSATVQKQGERGMHKLRGVAHVAVWRSQAAWDDKLPCPALAKLKKEVKTCLEKHKEITDSLYLEIGKHLDPAPNRKPGDPQVPSCPMCAGEREKSRHAYWWLLGVSLPLLVEGVPHTLGVRLVDSATRLGRDEIPQNATPRAASTMPAPRPRRRRSLLLLALLVGACAVLAVSQFWPPAVTSNTATQQSELTRPGPSPMPSQPRDPAATVTPPPRVATNPPASPPPVTASTPPAPPPGASQGNEPLPPPASPSGPAVPPTMSFASDSRRLALGALVTLTATLSKSLGAPYQVRLVDQTSGATVVQCTTGTVCGGMVAFTSETTHTYRAELLDNGNVIGRSTWIEVTWVTPQMTSFQADTTPKDANTSVEITATLDIPIDGSTFFIFVSMVDVTGHGHDKELKWCYAGTKCSVTVSSPPRGGSETFKAYLKSGKDKPAGPNPTVQSLTVVVTWPPVITPIH
jgi:DNA-binding CsgD family transcriptional regulator